jgi:hypothetical protein
MDLEKGSAPPLGNSGEAGGTVVGTDSVSNLDTPPSKLSQARRDAEAQWLTLIRPFKFERATRRRPFSPLVRKRVLTHGKS